MKPETRETLTMLFDMLLPAEKGQVFTALSNFILARMSETIRAELIDASEVSTDEIIFMFARVSFEEKYSVILDAIGLLDARQAVPARADHTHARPPTVTNETPAAPRHKARAIKTTHLANKARPKPAQRQTSTTAPTVGGVSK